MLLFMMIWKVGMNSVSLACQNTISSQQGCTTGCQKGHAYHQEFESGIINCLPCSNCDCPLGQYYESGNLARTVGCYPCPEACHSCGNPYFCSDGSCGCDGVIKELNSCMHCFTHGVKVRLLQARHLMWCDDMCVNCDSSTGICHECQSGQFLSSYTNSTTYYDCYCFSLGSICIACQAAWGDCTQCITGYYLQAGICTNCTPPCLTASGTNITSCISTTYSSGTSCLSCSNPCFNCTSSSICTSCITGYYLSSNGSCLLCTSPCLTVQDSLITSCIPTKYPSGTSCLSCSNPCVNCTSSSICTNCITGYYLSSNGSCLVCTSPCLTVQDSLITSCIPTTFSVGNSCDSCGIPHITCTSLTNYNGCINGYYFQNTQSPPSCELCNPDCKSCINSINFCTQCTFDNSAINNGTCSCISTYTLISPQNCDKCQFPCITCTNTVTSCLTCSQGYYLDSANCLQCPLGCIDCQSSLICNQCLDNYSVINFVCQPCLLPCVACIQSCQTCDPTKICTQCINNLILLNGTCQCQNQQYLDKFNNQCKQCIEPCLTCQSDNLCLSCNDKYYLRSNECILCTIPCQNCISQSICLSCIDNQSMMVQNGSCNCKLGMFYRNGLCLKCSLPCTSCINSSTYCLTCNGQHVNAQEGICISDPGYIYNFVIYQSDRCNLDCTTCSQIDFCSGCSFTNTTLQNGQCYCLEQFYLAQPQLCKQCVSPCVNCLTQSYCLTCTQSYYLAGSQCQICSTGCDQCIDNSSCLKCSTGYMQIEHQYSLFVTCLIITEQMKQQTQQVASYTTSILWGLLGLAIFGFLNGGISIFYNLLDIIQLVSYFQFINTILPYNLMQFLKLFQFAQLKFITQYFNVQNQLENYIEIADMQSGPQAIIDEGYTTISLINCSTNISIWITFFLTYQICKLMLRIMSKIDISANVNDRYLLIKFKYIFMILKIYIMKLCTFIVSEAFYSGIFRVYYSIAYDQAFTFNLTLFASNYSTDNYILMASEYFAIILAFIYFGILFKSIWVLNSSMQKLFSRRNQFRSLVEGLKKDPFSVYFNLFLLLKKYFVISSIIICYYIPLFQIGNIVFLSLLNILYLVILKPHAETFELKKQLFSEFCMLFSEGAVLVLIIDDNLPNTIINRTIVGWISIFAISLMLIYQMLLDFYLQWQTYIRIYRKVVHYIKKYIVQRQMENNRATEIKTDRERHIQI